MRARDFIESLRDIGYVGGKIIACFVLNGADDLKPIAASRAMCLTDEAMMSDASAADTASCSALAA